MKKFNNLQEVLDYLKSLDDFEVISQFKVSDDAVYAEDQSLRSIFHVVDRRIIERLEVNRYVEKIVKDQTAVQHVSNALLDHLDAREIVSFSLNRDNTIHIKFEDDHVLLVEVFYYEGKLTLEVASKYRVEDDQTCERISLSTKDRIELKDLFQTIEMFDQKAKKLIEVSQI